jgi:hypothetical protein
MQQIRNQGDAMCYLKEAGDALKRFFQLRIEKDDDSLEKGHKYIVTGLVKKDQRYRL